MATGKALDGKPYAGNPHVRFDEGEVAPAATPRRGSLLYSSIHSGLPAAVRVSVCALAFFCGLAPARMFAGGGPAVAFIGGDAAAGWNGAGADVWRRDFASGPRSAVNFARSGEKSLDTLRRLSDGMLDGVSPRAIVYTPEISGADSGKSILDEALEIRAVLRLAAKLHPEATVIVSAVAPHGETVDAPLRLRGDLVSSAVGCYVYRMTKDVPGAKLRMLDFNSLLMDGAGRLLPNVSSDGGASFSAAAYAAWSAKLKPHLDFVFDGTPPKHDPVARHPVAFERDITPRFAQISKNWFTGGFSADKAKKGVFVPDDRLAEKRRESLANPSRHFDLVMIGDSITHLFETGRGAEEWAKLAGGRRALNLGFGGNTVRNALWNVKYGGFLDGVSVDVVTLMIGTNNRSSDEKFIAAAVKEIVAAIREKQPRAKILLHPMIPRANPAHAELRAKNDRANVLIREIADGKNVVFVDLNPFYVKASPAKLKELLPDGTHPGAEGYRAWREAIEPFLPLPSGNASSCASSAALSRLALVPGGDSALFTPSEQPQATLVFSNAAAMAQTFSAVCRTEDYFGREVSSQTVSGKVPPAGVFSEALDLSAASAPGFYCTKVSWTCGGAKGSGECSFVKVAEPPSRPDRMFGISAFGKDPGALYAKLGVGTKAVYFDWRQLDDGKGNLDLDGIETYIKDLRKAGITVVGHIPASASGALPRRYFKRKAGPKEDPVADPPAMCADMQKYIEALVSRFKGEIREWAVSGEINLLVGRAPYYRQRYIETLAAVSRGVRKADPSAKLFALGCSGADGRDKPRFRFLQGMLPEVSGMIDGLGIDQYTAGQYYGAGFVSLDTEQSGLREIMLSAIAIARKNGKLLAIDEKGPAIVRSTPISSPEGRRMANMVARDYIILKTLPEVVHWLYFRPRNWNPRTVVDWGMREGANPRQAVSAYAATARIMAHAGFVKEKPLHRSIVCWVFENAAGPFAAIWHNGTEPLRFEMPHSAGLRITDVQGNPVSPDGGAVFLSDAPLYLCADSVEEIDRILDAAKYEVADIDGVVETQHAGRSVLALRNIAGREITARIVSAECTPPAEIPAAAAKGVRIGPGEVKLVEIGALPAHCRFTVESSSSRRLAVEGGFNPYVLRRVRGWEDVAKAGEIVLADPERQAPGFADLRSNGLYTGTDDLSARARFGYDDKRFYMEIRVKDDVHMNESMPARNFTGDCVQYAFDTLKDGRLDALEGKTGWGDDDYRFTSALASGVPTTFCNGAGAANRARMDSREYPAPSIVRDEKAKTTVYRIAVPFADLAPLAPEPGRVFGFSFLVFDRDIAAGTAYRIEFTPGLAGNVNPAQFGEFVFGE